MGLESLLLDHPFGEHEDLLHTIDRTVTAGEARAGAAAYAEQLRSLGVGAGQPVAVQLPNGPELVMALFGVWLAGAVFVPVNPRSPKAEVDRVVEGVEPVAFVTENGIERVGGAAVHDGDIAFVLWTSGTTGPPKPIFHTHTDYIELLDRVLGPLRTRPSVGERRPPAPNLIPVSMSLNAGLYNALFGLRAGAALVIMDGFDPSTLVTLVRRFAIRSTVLPPAAIAMLAADESIDDLAPLKYVRSITAPLSPLQARRFTERFSVYVLNGYGQAEIGEVIGWTAADAKEHPDKIGAAGRPHPGVELKLVDDHLFVKPPRMAAGLADRVDADGYVDTGDLARIDSDGFVWIEGRASDVINRGGNKVFPEHVEEVLRLSAAVADVAVVGVEDHRLGEVPVAFVVPAAGAELDEDALDALCREHLVAYKVPVAFEQIDAVPRNEVGKVVRADLRR
jgi:acyl-CoA synthetase (AMP-forming)/AMP-acid ligase II